MTMMCLGVYEKTLAYIFLSHDMCRELKKTAKIKLLFSLSSTPFEHAK
jgi:hypothetical protein